MANEISTWVEVYAKYGFVRDGRWFRLSGNKPIMFAPLDSTQQGDYYILNGVGTIAPLAALRYGYIAEYLTIPKTKEVYTVDEFSKLAVNQPTLNPVVIVDTINTVNAGVLGAINSTSATITANVNQVSNAISNNITLARQALDKSIDDTEGNILTRLATATTQTATNIGNASKEILNKIQSNVGQIDEVKNTLSNNIFTAANNTINSIGNSLNGVINNVVSNVINTAKNTESFLNSAISNSTGSISSQINTVKNNISASTQQINDNTNNALSGVISGVTDALNPLNALAGLLGADYKEFITRFIPDLGGDIGKSLQRIQNAINKLLNDEYSTWDEFVLDLGVFQANANLIETVFNISLIIPIVLNLFQNAGSIYSQNITKLLMEDVRPTSLQSPDILKAFLRKTISEDKTHELLAKLGFEDDFIRILKSNSNILLDVNEVKNLYLRGLIDETVHDTKLHKLGFRDDDINHFKQLYFATPPANDLIRMAVREVFTPQTVKTYGMDQDFPQDFARYAKEVGLDEHWAKAYWAAHWELPSPSMGFEMFHRGIITDTQVKELLKSLDVMPYWRDKLVQLSYNPVTRVDVRRLYQTGVITIADVEKRYRDIGYSPTDAKLLARWTEIDSSPEDDTTEQEIKALSKSVIETAYKKGVISVEQAKQSFRDLGYKESDVDIIIAIADLAKISAEDKDLSLAQEEKAHKYIVDAYKRRTISNVEAREQLLDLGISSNDIDIELSFADYEYQLSVKTSIVNKIQDMYLTNTIDDVELMTYLSVNGFNIKEVTQILDELVVLKSLRDRKPTKADFDKFLAAGVITNEEYIYELRGLGFADKYIEMYMLLKGDIEEE